MNNSADRLRPASDGPARVFAIAVAAVRAQLSLSRRPRASYATAWIAMLTLLLAALMSVVCATPSSAMSADIAQAALDCDGPAPPAPESPDIAEGEAFSSIETVDCEHAMPPHGIAVAEAFDADAAMPRAHRAAHGRMQGPDPRPPLS